MGIVEQYITDKYNATKWPYFGVNALMWDLKDQLTNEQIKDEIRELRKSGKIDLVTGLNGWLIKVIET